MRPIGAAHYFAPHAPRRPRTKAPAAGDVREQGECGSGRSHELRRGLQRHGYWTADRAIDKIRDRFGWEAVGYGSVVLGLSRSVPDEFRELAEKHL